MIKKILLACLYFVIVINPLLSLAISNLQLYDLEEGRVVGCIHCCREISICNEGDTKFDNLVDLSDRKTLKADNKDLYRPSEKKGWVVNKTSEIGWETYNWDIDYKKNVTYSVSVNDYANISGNLTCEGYWFSTNEETKMAKCRSFFLKTIWEHSYDTYKDKTIYWVVWDKVGQHLEDRWKWEWKDISYNFRLIVPAGDCLNVNVCADIPLNTRVNPEICIGGSCIGG